MGLIYFPCTVEEHIKRQRVLFNTATHALERADSSLYCQIVQQVQGRSISPLQVIQDQNKWAFNRQCVEIPSDSIIEISAFRFWTKRFWFWQFWQFKTYFWHNLGKIRSAGSQHGAQFLWAAGLHVSIDSINYWLIRKLSAHFITVTPENGCLL